MKGTTNRFPIHVPLRPLGRRWLLVLLFVVITVGFSITYTQLLYERHQAQAQLTLEQQRLAREKIRHHELSQAYEQARQSLDAFAAIYASRVLRRAAPGTGAEILIFTGEDEQVATADREDQPTEEEAAPIWRQWLQVLHIQTSP